jgi:hypothetical protein
VVKHHLGEEGKDLLPLDLLIEIQRRISLKRLLFGALAG